MLHALEPIPLADAGDTPTAKREPESRALRHSDPALTLGIYTDADAKEHAAALEALPTAPNAATAPQTPAPATENGGDDNPPPTGSDPAGATVGNGGECQGALVNTSGGGNVKKPLKNGVFCEAAPLLPNRQAVAYMISRNAKDGGEPASGNGNDLQESGAISGAKSPIMYRTISEIIEESHTAMATGTDDTTPTKNAHFQRSWRAFIWHPLAYCLSNIMIYSEHSIS